MLLAHKIELRPKNQEQIDYLNQACGARRHCRNQLLNHFSKSENKWSKKSAYQHYIKVLRAEYPWYSDISSRITRNAIDDLDNAFKHFFRRIKEGKKGKKVGFPKFLKKGINDSFALREPSKFGINGRLLRIEKLKSLIPMAQKVRFNGAYKQVSISKRADKFYVSVLVDTNDYKMPEQTHEIVGVDFGIKDLAVLSDGTVIPANQKLKGSMKKLARLQKNLSRKKVKTSKRRAKAKLKVARLHLRISNQRKAVLHELSDTLTSKYQNIVIEDLNVAGMVKNHKLARAVSDAGFGMLRKYIEYKAIARGVNVIVADRFFASSKTCCKCGSIHDMPLEKRQMVCDCGNNISRDLNASINLEKYGRLTLEGDLKRTQELCQTNVSIGINVDGVNMQKSAAFVDFVRH